MSEKTISIMFPQGGIIPASIMGTEKDQHVDALKPVTVPERYGRHLIDDRFAVLAPEVPAPKAKASRKGRLGEPAAADMLIGSNALPSIISLGADRTVTLGEVVAAAHKASGLSVQDWNALSEDDRDAMLADMIEAKGAGETGEA